MLTPRQSSEREVELRQKIAACKSAEACVIVAEEVRQYYINAARPEIESIQHPMSEYVTMFDVIKLGEWVSTGRATFDPFLTGAGVFLTSIGNDHALFRGRLVGSMAGSMAISWQGLPLMGWLSRAAIAGAAEVLSLRLSSRRRLCEASLVGVCDTAATVGLTAGIIGGTGWIVKRLDAALNKRTSRVWREFSVLAVGTGLALVVTPWVEQIAKVGAFEWVRRLAGASWREPEVPVVPVPLDVDLPEPLICPICRGCFTKPVVLNGIVMCEADCRPWVAEQHTHPVTGVAVAVDAILQAPLMTAVAEKWKSFVIPTPAAHPAGSAACDGT